MNDVNPNYCLILVVGLLIGFLLGAYVERCHSPLNYDKPVEVMW